jgi:hypothetical protein
VNDDLLNDIQDFIDEEECPCCRMMKEEWGMIESAPRNALLAAGIPLPRPETVADDQLRDVLWRVINGLAELRIFLDSTDHLSDRDLYTLLHDDILGRPMFYSPNDPYSAAHVSMVGSGSDEDTELWLRYYADEMTRARWATDFPDDVIPPHDEPPHQRDELLPHRLDIFETLH